MRINETASFIIIEDAPLSFHKAVTLIPYQLVWFEVKVNMEIMEDISSIEGTAYPESVDQIIDFDLSKTVDMEEIEKDEGIEVKLNLYYLKER